MAETSHHSLSFLFDQDEFRAQVDDHVALMQSTFGVTPSFFRNTELTYDNRLADWLKTDGRFRGVCCEGVDRLLGDGRSPNYVYGPPGTLAAGGEAPLAVLLKNYRLSDDVAFRFPIGVGPNGRSEQKPSRAGSTASTAMATSATSLWTTRPLVSTSGLKRAFSLF